MFLPFFMLVNTGYKTYNNFFVKKTMQLGVSPESFVYGLNIGLLFLSPLLFLW